MAAVRTSTELRAGRRKRKGGEADEHGNTDRSHRDRGDALLRRKIHLQREEERDGLHRLPVRRKLSEKAADERLLQMTG